MHTLATSKGLKDGGSVGTVRWLIESGQIPSVMGPRGMPSDPRQFLSTPGTRGLRQGQSRPCPFFLSGTSGPGRSLAFRQPSALPSIRAQRPPPSSGRTIILAMITAMILITQPRCATPPKGHSLPSSQAGGRASETSGGLFMNTRRGGSTKASSLGPSCFLG